jgi:hypothetical protein
MGIAYAQMHQLYGRVRANTSVNLRADLDIILNDAGWSNKVAVSNGYKYSLLSPQSLTCKVLIKDKGTVVGPVGVHAITIQFMSNDEMSLGMEHHLAYGVYTQYQVIVGYCQLFISLPSEYGGGTLGAYFHTFAGGIPRIPDGTSVDCVAEHGADISQSWWTCSSGEYAFGITESFRSHLYCNYNYSYNRNGLVTIGTGPQTQASPTLQLYTIKPTTNVEIQEYLGHSPPTKYYGTNTPLDIDAFVGWGYYIQGQIWDAFLRTGAGTVDGVVATQELDSDGNYYFVYWKAYNSTFYGTLYLRYTDPEKAAGDGSNYVY